MKVLVATEKPFAAVAVEGIKKEIEGAGNELVLLEKYTDVAQLLDAVKDADAMIVRSDKVTPAVLDAAKNLKIVVRAGAGYDSIDTAYAKEKGVIVENTPGQNSNAVAELVFGLMVYAVRNFYNARPVQNLWARNSEFWHLVMLAVMWLELLKALEWTFMLTTHSARKRLLRRLALRLLILRKNYSRTVMSFLCIFLQLLKQSRASTIIW